MYVCIENVYVFMICNNNNIKVNKFKNHKGIDINYAEMNISLWGMVSSFPILEVVSHIYRFFCINMNSSWNFEYL